MQMKMIFEGLIPGVQHGDDPYRSTKTRAAELKERFAEDIGQLGAQLFLSCRELVVGQQHDGARLQRAVP